MYLRNYWNNDNNTVHLFYVDRGNPAIIPIMLIQCDEKMWYPEDPLVILLTTHLPN